MIEIVSPLRYPGGKSRAIKNILPLIPYNFDEFIEPFVGGGSVFISARQNIFNNAKYVINDLNFDLYCFWKYAKEAAKPETKSWIVDPIREHVPHPKQGYRSRDDSASRALGGRAPLSFAQQAVAGESGSSVHR